MTRSVGRELNRAARKERCCLVLAYLKMIADVAPFVDLDVPSPAVFLEEVFHFRRVSRVQQRPLASCLCCSEDEVHRPLGGDGPCCLSFA